VYVCDFAFSWVWTEAGAQPHVEDALSIGGFGYPVTGLALFHLSTSVGTNVGNHWLGGDLHWSWLVLGWVTVDG